MLLFILRKQTEARNGTQISKHLMLLFIKLKKLYELYATKFQNISCYCLSFLPRIQTFDLRDFKTSHVIVYLLSVCSFDRKYFISKHLMLLFIPRISAFFSFSPPLFPLIFSIFLHFLPANTLILNRPTYHPINLLIFQAFLDFSFFFRLVKIL